MWMILHQLFKTIRSLRSKHIKNVLLELNFLRNKFESVSESESKLESNFLDSRFSIPGYCIITKDRDKNGGGINFYIDEDIPFKVIESIHFRKFRNISGNLEILTLEIILDNMKIILMGLYQPLSLNK